MEWKIKQIDNNSLVLIEIYRIYKIFKECEKKIKNLIT